MTFYSCDSNRVFDENKTIKSGVWNYKDKIVLKADIKDTTSFNNVYVNVRNSGSYGFSNLYLFITTIFPDGKMARDTVECILADPTGKWLGKGLGDLKDNRILFKRGVRFPMSGKYTFELEQAMRIDDLTSIKDVGMRIEKIVVKE
ncbi:MAG: gliding motility lipoprotein GldH [Bacteroidota bacterium]|nr:gliding motility lipoprotein GldH [Bacteroidota bacterium]